MAFLACGLFLKAIEAGHAVLFMTLRELAQVLEAPRLPGQHDLLRRYAQPKLLVIDEVGYTLLDRGRSYRMRNHAGADGSASS